MEVVSVRFFIFSAKVFAVSLLIFLNSSFAIAQTESIYVLPAGKRIRVRMDTEINSKVASLNDTFIVRIAEPVSNGGVEVLPAGTIIDGRVAGASSADIAGVNGKLDVSFIRLRVNRNEAVEMDGRLLRPLKPPSRTLFGFLTIAGLTTAGAVFGAASNAKNGAAIGAAIGAGSGTGITFLRKGQDVRIKTNEVFEIELKKELVLPAKEY